MVEEEKTEVTTRKFKTHPSGYKELVGFTVDRSKWLFGDECWIDSGGRVEQNISRLLVDSGKRCCLGFLADALGLKSEDILNEGHIEAALGMVEVKELDFHAPRLEALIEADEGIPPSLVVIYNTNDSNYITAEEREEVLKTQFLVIGLKVEFVGEYPE